MRNKNRVGCSLTSYFVHELVFHQEKSNQGKPHWEHLNDELHVLIQCEDTRNRAEVKLQRALEEVRRLLIPAVRSAWNT